MENNQIQYTAVIILNYNNSIATKNCIESVIKYNTSPVKFIIIDNGSKEEDYKNLLQVMTDEFKSFQIIDKSNQSSSENLEKAVLIRSEENLGYACGNNIGLKYVYPDPQITNILILNNDILFVQDLIPSFLAAKEKLTESAILTPLLLKKDGKDIDYNCARRQIKLSEVITDHFLTYIRIIFRIDSTEANRDHYLLYKFDDLDSPKKIELPSGSCMFVDKDYFESIGGFDPNTFLYQEENILYEKIKRTNKYNYILPFIKCIHLGSNTISELPNQVKLMKIAMASEEYFVMNYLKPGFFQKYLYKFSKWFLLTSFRLQKFIFNKK